MSYARAGARYLSYEDMTGFLRDLTTAHPQLVRLLSIGTSYEGRELWAVEAAAGAVPAALRPALYIDGNHHAGEVTGSAVCLYTLGYLVDQYGRDPLVTELLDTRTIYVVPRVSPDGAERYLTTPYMLRSSVRPWPYPEQHDGLVPEDVDGNGVLLMMRVPDPDGCWRVSHQDPRVMVRRRPDEYGGSYYHLLPEGRLLNYDGAALKVAPPRWGLDFNRNYPGTWAGEHRQPGAGPFPFSEPETRAIGEFFLAHLNIAAAMSYHTTGGVILRPRCTAPDSELSADDREALRSLGRRGTELTGYPAVSIFEGFTADRRRPAVGSFIDFVYEQRGILGFATELWDLSARAGIVRREPGQARALSEAEAEADQLQLLKWVDRELGGRGFHAWKRFDHPELGAVDIGGLEPKFLRQNPPPHLLEQECHKNMLFTLSLAAATPRLLLADAAVRPAPGGRYELSVVVGNSGYLPTDGSQQAAAMRAVPPVVVRLEPGEGVSVEFGREREEIARLPGRAQGGLGMKQRLRWLLAGPPGAEVTVVASSARAGTVRTSLVLG